MRYTLLLFGLLLAFSMTGLAQKGTAEPDYYPMNYSGDTWTGLVTSSNEETREFTLTYKKGDKEQTFVGLLPKGYTVKMKDGRDHEVKMAELMGMRLKAYYMTKTSKDAGGTKVKVNNVFKVRFMPPEK